MRCQRILTRKPAQPGSSRNRAEAKMRLRSGSRVAQPMLRFQVLHTHSSAEAVMLKWALIFAVVSIIAGVLGFTGVAAGAASIAQVLFFVFLLLCALFLVLGLFVYNKVVD
jgi:uncharacterized membrane protein YtjA (UPF0391 family)